MRRQNEWLDSIGIPQLLRHGLDGLLRLGSDLIHVFIRENHRLPHDEIASKRNNQCPALGKVTVQTIEVNGNDWNPGVAGSQMAHTALKIAH